MIVKCPACDTRYKHRPELSPAALKAVCGHCDERFPLAPSPRQYRLVPGGEGQAAHADGVVMAPALQDSRSRSMLEPLLALFLAAAGAGSGYYLSLMQHTDPVTWTAGGCSAGLLLGWVVIRWMASRS